MHIQVVSEMGKDTKIVHFSIIDGTQEDIRNLSIALGEMKKRVNLDIEFLVTNDKIQLSSVEDLLTSLYTLYKMKEKAFKPIQKVGEKSE